MEKITELADIKGDSLEEVLKEIKEWTEEINYSATDVQIIVNGRIDMDSIKEPSGR